MAKAKNQTTDGEKSRSKKSPKTVQSDNAPEDTMSQCVALCQEQHWREAALLCRHVHSKAERDGKNDLAMSLDGALKKIEFSLRRQMAATLAFGAKKLLKKEYLLDAGQQ